MPLTSKGRQILEAMKKQYGDKKGEEVFYSSANAGKITGVHESMDTSEQARGAAACVREDLRKRCK